MHRHKAIISDTTHFRSPAHRRRRGHDVVERPEPQVELVRSWRGVKANFTFSSLATTRRALMAIPIGGAEKDFEEDVLCDFDQVEAAEPGESTCSHLEVHPGD
jgi:hypothetical protein